jgi:hypothetical protein
MTTEIIDLYLYGISSSQADFILRHQIAESKPDQIVDFGAGAGKNGRIAREILGKDVKLMAVEGYKKTADMLSELTLYDEVHHCLIQNWIDNNIDKYDFAIFGDVLEHLTHKEIHNVIRQSLKVFDRIIIICPLHDVLQENLYNNPLEVHKSYITSSFFDKYNLLEKHIIRGSEWTIMNVVIVPNNKCVPLYRKLSLFLFHKCMIVLQPIGLALPFVNFLRHTMIRFKWLLKD